MANCVHTANPALCRTTLPCGPMQWWQQADVQFTSRTHRMPRSSTRNVRTCPGAAGQRAQPGQKEPCQMHEIDFFCVSVVACRQESAFLGLLSERSVSCACVSFLLGKSISVCIFFELFKLHTELCSRHRFWSYFHTFIQWNSFTHQVSVQTSIQARLSEQDSLMPYFNSRSALKMEIYHARSMCLQHLKWRFFMHTLLCH